MTISYEWDVELQTSVETEDHEAGEVIDHNHVSSFKEALALASRKAQAGHKNVIVLVRDDDIRSTRSWAYHEDGIFPLYFHDAYGNRCGKVPLRFIVEVGKALQS